MGLIGAISGICGPRSTPDDIGIESPIWVNPVGSVQFEPPSLSHVFESYTRAMTVIEREPLTRGRVAAAALSLIDENGLDALSMRKLGAVLGVEAMSLYNHVDNKDDLLNAVTDLVYAEIFKSYGSPAGDWREKARRLAASYVHAAEAHPESLPLLIDRPGDTPGGLQLMDRVASIFDGVTDDLRSPALAFSAVSAYVVGTLFQERSADLSENADPAAVTELPEGFEAVARFRAALGTMSVAERFDEGLEAMLDGLEARYFS